MTFMRCAGISLPEAYHKSLVALDQYGKDVSCPAWGTNCREISMEFTVANPLSEPMISRFFIGGFRELEQYRLEMLDGILDWAITAGREPYTYHDRYKDQLQAVIDELRRDKFSRRAKLIIARPEDITMADAPCLQYIQFFVRNGLLDCYALFRSNDALEAAFMNAYALIRLQERVAHELGVKVGTYTHKATSYHVYDKDRQRLKDTVRRITHWNRSLYYRYKGDWDGLMEAERPGILADMDKLKERYNAQNYTVSEDSAAP